MEKLFFETSVGVVEFAREMGNLPRSCIIVESFRTRFSEAELIPITEFESMPKVEIDHVKNPLDSPGPISRSDTGRVLV